MGGPYVLRCYLDSDPLNQHVAGVYDGVSYPLAAYGFDCMYLADQDFAIEFKAYEEMPAHLQSSIVPRYNLSWAFSPDVLGQSRKGWVRMVLLEHIRAEAMVDLIVKEAMLAGPSCGGIADHA